MHHYRMADTPKTPPDSDETLEALKRRIEASPELRKTIASRQIASNAFQQATNPKPPKESAENEAKAKAGTKTPEPPGDKPWYTSRDLVVGLFATGIVTVMGIILVIAPPPNPHTLGFWLVIIFCIFSFSLGLMIHYFWHSRLAIVAGILTSALLTGGFGWHVWPPPDWRRSDEAKQLASQMTSDVQKLEDEGRLIDLTDYHRAIKVYADWVEKCSVTLGRIDNQMRRFSRETTYRYYFEKSGSETRKLLSDKLFNENRTILGGVIQADVLALQAVEKALVVDTSPGLDPNYPQSLSQ